MSRRVDVVTIGVQTAIRVFLIHNKNKGRNMTRSDIPKPDKLNIELHDFSGNVKSAFWLRCMLLKWLPLSDKQLKVVSETNLSCFGKEYETYTITSTKNVSFARWEVCSAFCEGLRGY